MDQLIRVLVVEDLPDMRVIIQDVIDRQPDFEVVGAAGNGEEGLTLYQELRPDILMTNVMMPVMDGLTLAGQIRAMDPEARIMISTGRGDPGFIKHGLEIGASWVLVKPFSEQTLLESLRAVAKGEPPSSNLEYE
jgi:YesN/AraC family two-component response regulator